MVKLRTHINFLSMNFSRRHIFRCRGQNRRLSVHFGWAVVPFLYLPEKIINDKHRDKTLSRFLIIHAANFNSNNSINFTETVALKIEI